MKILILITIVASFLSLAISQDNEYDPCGEYYHWEANQVNPFADTKVIIDPYSD